MKIAHLFNPIAKPADPELALGQKLAIGSMTLAARADENVELLTAQFPEDRFLSDPFRATPDLTRSVLDGRRRSSSTPREREFLKEPCSCKRQVAASINGMSKWINR